MFTLSSKAVYGLSAALELAISYGKGPIQAKQIAEIQKIPQHYLEQLLVLMRKCGIVDSRRGAQGGYELARHPSNVTVGELLVCLDGKLQVADDPREENPLEFYWKSVESAVTGRLSISLQDLMMEKQENDGLFNYVI